MSNNINVVVTDQTIVVPDTGNFSSGVTGLGEVKTISIISLLILVLASIATIIFINNKRRKNANTNKESKFSTLIRSILLISGISGFFLSSVILGISSRAIDENQLDFKSEDITIYVVRNGEENTFATASTEITLEEYSEYGYDLLANGGGVLTLEGGTDTISLVAPSSALATNTYGITAEKNNLSPTDEIWNSISDETPFFTQSEIEEYDVDSKITINYGVYISADLPAGTYTGKVQYDLNKRTCTTTFDRNYGGAGVIKQSTTCGEKINLPEDPIRPGYAFVGWWTTPDDSGEEITGDEYVFDDSDIYYAHWLQNCNPNPTTIGTGNDTDAICMQDLANLSNADKNSVLSSMDYNEQYQLRDNRDNKMYYISKLEDGRIWMTQNLDFDLISDKTDSKYVELTSENTDLNLYGSMGYDDDNGYSCKNSNNTNCSDGVISWLPERSTIATDDLATKWRDSYTDPYSWAGYEDEAPDGEKDGHGYTGNYYNRAASIASNNSNSYNIDSLNAANSICPAGWRLPNIKTYEFGKLFSAYGIIDDITNISYADKDTSFNILNNEPLYFIRSGFVYNSARDGYGNEGYYRPSANSIIPYDYYLGFTSSSIHLNNQGYTPVGGSLRCLVKSLNYTITFNANGGELDPSDATRSVEVDFAIGNLPIPNNTNYIFAGWFTQATGGERITADTIPQSDTTYYAHWITEMQDFATLSDTEKVLVSNFMTEDTQYRLLDNRDDAPYYVSKLKDGNIWMTDNLRFSIEEGQSGITSENTDLNLYGNIGYDSSNGYACTGSSSPDCSGGIISWTPSELDIEQLADKPHINKSRIWYTPDGEKDGHGYVGIYYNWTAAIASNNSSAYDTAGMVAANSICPAGWKLPNTSTYDFSKLLYAYGITMDPLNTSGYKDSTGFDKINNLPLYFIRSGMDMSGINAYGEYGWYQSSYVKSATTSGALEFSSNSVYPNSNSAGHRSIGISMRCMIKTSDANNTNTNENSTNNIVGTNSATYGSTSANGTPRNTSLGTSQTENEANSDSETIPSATKPQGVRSSNEKTTESISSNPMRAVIIISLSIAIALLLLFIVRLVRRLIAIQD